MKTQLPKRKQKAEIFWQTLDVAVVLAIACLIIALFVQDIIVSVVLGIVSLASITLYLFIELRIEYELVKAKRPKQQYNAELRESRKNLLVWGAVISALAVGNFFLFFARHGVTVHEIPPTAPLYKDAIVLMLLTIVLCLLANTLHHRFHFSKTLNLKGIHKARTIKSIRIIA